MLSRFSFFAISAAALVLAGCGSSSEEDAARLRVLHGSPNAPAVDVLVDNSVRLTNVPYRTASGYLDVTAGSRNIKVNATGATTSVIDANVSLAKDTDTTVIATNVLASIEPLVLTDNNTAPAAGQIKLRLVHAAPGAGNVDIYVTAPDANLATTTPTLSNIPFKGVSSYLSVPAGTYRVRITGAGSKDVAIDSGSLALSVGQIRTAVALGNPGTGQALTAVVLADN
jgi:hypothetical protein